MSDALPRPPYVPVDSLTPDRDITHGHFQPGDQVMIVKGVADGRLWGDAMTVVAPSWHTPTGEDGWRLRDPDGGERTYLTGHPRYLVHLSRRCPDCLIYLRAVEDYLLSRFPNDRLDCGWYTITALNELLHIDDKRAQGGR